MQNFTSCMSLGVNADPGTMLRVWMCVWMCAYMHDYLGRGGFKFLWIVLGK
jgi:hypothetical protein